jgi:hypothetical protein
MKLVIMQSSPLPYHFVTLRPKYILRHPNLENPRPMPLPQRERQSFTTNLQSCL